MTVHHKTGELVYFNQFTALHESYFFYHPSWTKTNTSKASVNVNDTAVPFGGADGAKFEWVNQDNGVAPDLPPFTVLYGDGSPVPQEDIDVLRSTIWNHTKVFQLQAGDILVLDNILAAHSRLSWEAEETRKLFVSIAEPVGWNPPLEKMDGGKV